MLLPPPPNLTVVPIHFPWEDNPLHPLPPDYSSLSTAGKRLARVNGLRQWMYPFATEGERTEANRASLRLLSSYYLRGDGDFNPGYYNKGFFDNGLFHDHLISLWANHPYSVIALPRGGGKSTKFEEVTIRDLVTYPSMDMLYVTNNQDNTKARSNKIRYQLYNNSRLNDDFSQEFGGPIEPAKSDASKGIEHFYLRNRANIRFSSVGSGLRGGRFHVIGIDDPENDESRSTPMDVAREYMERLMFSVVMPMTFEPGACVRWLLTFVSARHYGWAAVSTTTLPSGEQTATDPRFNHWCRLVAPAGHTTDTGALVSYWRSKWPATIAEKKADGGPLNRTSLEEMPSRMGQAVFDREMMHKAASVSGTFFPHPLSESQHGYSIEGIDPAYVAREFYKSQALVVYHNGTEIVRTPLASLLANSRTAITVDYAYTTSATSDFSGCMLHVLAPGGVRLILDLFLERCSHNKIVREVLQMADRWRCPSVHPEVVKVSYTLFRDLQSIVAQRRGDQFSITHYPAIRELKTGMLDKNAKISSLLPLFEAGQIKLPLSHARLHPWSSLFSQLEGFHPSLDNGGLAHDDAADLLCMGSFVLGRSLPGPKPITPDDLPAEYLTALKAGRKVDKNGVPLHLLLPYRSIPAEDLEALVFPLKPAKTPHRNVI